MSPDEFSGVLESIGRFYHFDGYPNIIGRHNFHGMYSNVDRVTLECGRDRHTVYLKVLRDDVSWAGEVIRPSVMGEFDILCALTTLFKDSEKLGVACPVAVFPEHQMLVTEEVVGAELQSLITGAVQIFAPPKRMTDAMAYCRLAGTWLQRFQASTNIGNGPFDLEGLIAYCRQRLQYLARQPRSGFDEGLCARIIENLRIWNDKVDPDQHRKTGRHNDYSPHNIIVKNGNLKVLDFGFFDHDSYAFDVYRFWHSLECLKSSFHFSSSRIRCLQRAFLDSYADDVDLSAPIYRMVGCRYQITKLCAIYEDCATVGPRGLAARFLYRQCRNWLLSV